MLDNKPPWSCRQLIPLKHPYTSTENIQCHNSKDSFLQSTLWETHTWLVKMFTKFIYFKNSSVIVLKLTIWVYGHIWRMHHVISRNSSGLHFFNAVSPINYLFALVLINTFLSNKPAGCWTARPATLYITFLKKKKGGEEELNVWRKKFATYCTWWLKWHTWSNHSQKVLSFVFPAPRPYLHMFRYSSQCLNVKELLLGKMLYNAQSHSAWKGSICSLIKCKGTYTNMKVSFMTKYVQI